MVQSRQQQGRRREGGRNGAGPGPAWLPTKARKLRCCLGNLLQAAPLPRQGSPSCGHCQMRASQVGILDTISVHPCWRSRFEHFSRVAAATTLPIPAAAAPSFITPVPAAAAAAVVTIAVVSSPVVIPIVPAAAVIIATLVPPAIVPVSAPAAAAASIAVIPPPIIPVIAPPVAIMLTTAAPAAPLVVAPLLLATIILAAITRALLAPAALAHLQLGAHAAALLACARTVGRALTECH